MRIGNWEVRCYHWVGRNVAAPLVNPGDEIAQQRGCCPAYTGQAQACWAASRAADRATDAPSARSPEDSSGGFNVVRPAAAGCSFAERRDGGCRWCEFVRDRGKECR
jgi:hypothetical protein